MTTKETIHKRRTLFKRQKTNLPPLALTERDLCILKLLDAYRFLNTPQIQALVGGSKHNVSERLLRLFQHGYLDRPAHQRELRIDGYRHLVHALSQRGAALLAERLGDESYVSHHLAENNKTTKRMHLAHTLMVSQFRACLTLACRAHADFTLVSWETPERALMRFLIAGQRVPVIPDAYFVLEDSDGHAAHFYLEADRGTMTQKRFLRKLQAYWRFRHIDSDLLFPRSFRVVTIAPSQERTKNLTATAKDADSKRKGSLMFYFAVQDACTLQHSEAVLDYIWHSPADNKLHSLLEGKRATKSS
jgi:hypothetical protein